MSKSSTQQDFDEEIDDIDDEDELLVDDVDVGTGPYELHPEHSEYQKKLQHVRTLHWKHLVPVPIGPALPRRDRPELYPKYARLMLILFKPWRTEADLRGGMNDWAQAFDEFVKSCSPEIRKMLDNMQLLHECKDSKNS
ncbi:hypothetical protein BJ322DRAFT_1013146, partial [Thelephora terrestris]